MTEQQIVGIQKAIRCSSSREQLRKAIQKKLRERGLSPVTAADGGHRPYEARLIGEAQLVEHVQMGWEVVRELQNGQVLVRKPN